MSKEDIEKISSGLSKANSRILVLETRIEYLIENGKRRDKWIFCIISLLLSLVLKSFL